MATIKVRFYVNEIANVLLQFDQVKVYRSATETGTYTEITGVGTRVVLVAGQAQYEYIDITAPDNTYWYKTAYFNSGTLAEDVSVRAIQGIDGGLIVSLEDIRNEGLDSDDLSDDRAIFLSRGWQAWFEDRTGIWYQQKSRTFLLDGDGSRVMWLPVPIISVTALYINDDFTIAVDTSDYTVYNRYYPNDDRRNPRIKLKRSSGDIYSSGSGHLFVAGDQNQKLIGVFGYVEEDGSPPYGVFRAIMQLIAITSENMSDGDIDVLRGGRAVEEVTDRHRIKFANTWDDILKWAPTGLTDVDNALQMYRRPAQISMARRF